MYLFKFKTVMVCYKTIIFIKMFLNSKRGDSQPIPIRHNDEKVVDLFWIKNLPLKLITHGWLTSHESDKEVLAIKSGLNFFFFN